MTDPLRDQLQTTLGPAYSLERELGGGGMSRVFVADEPRLGRKIVVKVLAPALAVGVSAERFEREIRLAAALQHANIVPLLAAGAAAEGLPYYTMPFVDGLSLRGRLERDGALPVGEVVNVLRDVARALAYAHEHGVVHRDVKPENILLSGHAAVVTDFGIAKALAASRTAAADGTLTRVGTSIGTPAYMAPEQAAGDPATDHRADLYALGCVAYEMLTGHAPFAGRAPHQLLAAHLTDTPAPVDAERPDVPPALATLVMQCLAKDPAARPPSAEAVLERLDQAGAGHASGGTSGREGGTPLPHRRRAVIAAVSALVVLVALGGWALLSARANTATTASASAGAADARTLAVLPFENQGDSSDAYFAEGITDAVRGKLIALPGMSVIARASSRSYAGTETPLPTIARQLGVRYLLTGTVRFAGTGANRRVQVSPELVEVTAGHAPESRWAQSFDAATKDVFGVQADIAGRVASAMQVALGGDARAQLAQAPTADLAAYDAFLRGEEVRTAASSDPRSIRRGVAAYQEAIRLDSTMAPAWAGLGTLASMLYSNSTPSPEIARMARTAVERAVALDSNSAAGYLALAAYHRAVTRDAVGERTAVRRARSLAPQDVEVRTAEAVNQQDAGALDAAARDLAEVARLDPRNVAIWRRRTEVLLQLGRVTEARASAERLLALAPASLTSVLVRVTVEAAAGDLAGARRITARAERDLPREAVVATLGNFWDLGWTLGPEDERLLLSLGPEAFDGDRATAAIVRAQQYGWRGDAAQARAWGDSAAREMATQLVAVPDDPQRHVVRGLALAYAGRGPEAVAEAERGIALQAPTAEARRGLFFGYLSYVAARTALLVGDRDRALRWLADSRRAHYFAGPAWLRAEPTWAPLRNDPRFRALASEPARAR